MAELEGDGGEGDGAGRGSGAVLDGGGREAAPWSRAASVKAPRQKDDRIILHFDYDCFYAQVVENQQPALRSLPLGIRQKSILATCNYPARRRGVTKLMSIADARAVCPELVLVEGEDLSPFRDVSKQLYGLLRAHSWGGRLERLGLDEVTMDVTDAVAYNVALLSRADLARSFFHLSARDPERGFAFDATAVAGCVDGSPRDAAAADGPLYLRLVLASHLARYLRAQIEEQGYTCACGISTNKLLSKMVGARNKPRSQTTLLCLRAADRLAFMDGHRLRKVPGIGAKTTRLLEAHVLARVPRPEAAAADCPLTVGEARTHPHMSPALLEKLLGGPGAERGIGDRVWGLLHGVDPAEVKAASDIPSQISIEDTYRGLSALSVIAAELAKLSASLLRRMHVDLVDDGEHDEGKKWLAHPRTLRLTTRPKFAFGDDRPYNAGRATRSQPLPPLVFSFAAPREHIVERLVCDTLLPMFHRLNPDSRAWNVGLLNVCVANMVPAGADDPASTGRDISAMFRRQEDVLREFRIYDHGPPGVDAAAAAAAADEAEASPPWAGDEPDDEDLSSYDRDSLETCPLCGHLIPAFAVAAHQTYHTLGE